MYLGIAHSVVWNGMEFRKKIVFSSPPCVFLCLCIVQNEFPKAVIRLKVHKIENFFDSDFGICVISLLVMS